MSALSVTADAEKLQGLRRMKVVAVGALVLAAIIYVFAFLLERDGVGWAGYVRAAAEAGMVGALADWFAVTALFKRPLGLPIPHTAIIPTRKNAIGRNLGDFIGTNFLAEDVVRGRIRVLDVGLRVGGWISDYDNARRVSAEVAVGIKAGIGLLDDEQVRSAVEEFLRRRAEEFPVAEPAGNLLGQVVADKAHVPLIDLIAGSLHDWLRDNQTRVVDVVERQAPGWSPKWADDLVAQKVYREAVKFAQAVRDDKMHPLRTSIDEALLQLSNDLRFDADMQFRAEQAKIRMLDHPEVARTLQTTGTVAKEMLLRALDDPTSDLRVRIVDSLVSIGRSLVNNEQTRNRVNTWVEDAAVHVVKNNRDEITALITETVDRWDAEETSRKIEIQVGRDLQFIRLNGTLVGALAGLAIYTFSHAFLV
ncbi:MAG TPA: DUF445 domain-containing protein [Actinomycetota bacterium]|nr:DUF445 domain-containing protein [Actinomycetota bacterium]